MEQKLKVRFEGIHGVLVEYGATMRDLRAYLLPGWFPLWEKDEAGQERLAMLSPELTHNYRVLIASKKNP
jgi:cell wall assembly regulator SMI1